MQLVTAPGLNLSSLNSEQFYITLYQNPDQDLKKQKLRRDVINQTHFCHIRKNRFSKSASKEQELRVKVLRLFWWEGSHYFGTSLKICQNTERVCIQFVEDTKVNFIVSRGYLMRQKMLKWDRTGENGIWLVRIVRMGAGSPNVPEIINSYN